MLARALSLARSRVSFESDFTKLAKPGLASPLPIKEEDTPHCQSHVNLIGPSLTISPMSKCMDGMWEFCLADWQCFVGSKF